MAKITRNAKPYPAPPRHRVTIAIDRPVYDTGARLAKLERRSFSNWIGILIERAWKEQNQ